MTFNLRPLARGLLREPLLHFILLGALIYLVYGLTQQTSVDPDQRTLTVTASEIDWLEFLVAETLEPFANARGTEGFSQGLRARDDPLPRSARDGPRQR